MYLTVHPSLVSELIGCPPDLVDIVGDFFGSSLEETCPNHCEPAVRVTCQPVKIPSTARLIGHEAAYDNSYLYRLDSFGKALAYRLGGPDHASLLVDPEVSPSLQVYILEYLLKYLAPARNIAFVHASGVIYGGQGVLVPAWGGSGKTSLVLQFLDNGAEYMGDDLVLLDDLGTMYPYRKPLNLLSYNVRQFESLLLPSLKSRAMRFYHISNVLAKVQGQMGTKTWLGRRIRQVREAAEARVGQYVVPNQIFPQSKIGSPVHVGVVLFLTRVPGDEVTITTGDPACLAAKMEACLRWERQHYGDEILLYQFAFPNERSLLQEMMDGEEAVIRKGFGAAGRLLEVCAGDQVSNREIFEQVCRVVSE